MADLDGDVDERSIDRHDESSEGLPATPPRDYEQQSANDDDDDDRDCDDNDDDGGGGGGGDGGGGSDDDDDDSGGGDDDDEDDVEYDGGGNGGDDGSRNDDVNRDTVATRSTATRNRDTDTHGRNTTPLNFIYKMSVSLLLRGAHTDGSSAERETVAQPSARSDHSTRLIG